MKFFNAAAAVAMLCATFSAVAAPDIAGVTLGMSVQQAKAVFKPAIRTVMTDISNNNRVNIGIIGYSRGSLNDDTGSPEEFLAYQGEAESIWIVERHVKLAEAERYTEAALQTALRAKFGTKESFFEKDLKQMIWIFDANGKQLFYNFNNELPCAIGAENSERVNVYSTSVQASLTGPPRNFQTGCNTFYYASWYKDQNNLVMGTRIIMQNSGAMVSLIQGRENRAKNEQQQRTREQVNKNIQPKL